MSERSFGLNEEYLNSRSIRDAGESPTAELQDEITKADVTRLKEAESSMLEAEAAKTANVDEFGREIEPVEEDEAVPPSKTLEDIITTPSRYAMDLLSGKAFAEAPQKAERTAVAIESVGHITSEVGFASIANTASALEGLSRMLYENLDIKEKTGIERGDFFQRTAQWAEEWSKYHADQVTFDNFVNRSIGNLLNAPMGIAEFTKGGPAWAGLREFGNSGELTKGVEGMMKWMMAHKAFQSFADYNPLVRHTASGSYMGGEHSVAQYAATGEIDPATIAKNVAEGMLISTTYGGNRPGRMSTYLTPERLAAGRLAQAEASKPMRQIKAAREQGLVDDYQVDYARMLLAANPELQMKTSIEVKDLTRRLQKGRDEWMLEARGIDPASVDIEGYGIVGEQKSRGLTPEHIDAVMIRLYNGSDLTTIFEELNHGFYDTLPASERQVVGRAHKTALESEATTIKDAKEWFAEFGFKQFATEAAPKEKTAIKSLVATGKSLIDKVRGVPGNNVDMEAVKAISNKFLGRDLSAALETKQAIEKATELNVPLGKGVAVEAEREAAKKEEMLFLPPDAVDQRWTRTSYDITPETKYEQKWDASGPEGVPAEITMATTGKGREFKARVGDKSSPYSFKTFDEATDWINNEYALKMDPSQRPPVITKPSYSVRPMTERAMLESVINPDIPMPEQIYAKESNLNLRRLSTPEEIKQALNVLSDANAEESAKRGRGYVSQATMKNLASDLGMSVNQLLSRRKGEVWNAEQMLAARQILARSAQELMVLAKAAKDVDSAQNLANFMEYLSIHNAIQQEVSGATKEAGRLLSQFNVGVGTNESNLVLDMQPDQVLEAMGGPNRSRKLAEMMVNLSALAERGAVSVDQVNRFASKAIDPGWSDMLVELWVTSILSGPQTHARNVLSNALVAALSVPERAAAETVSGIRTAASKALGRDTDPDRVRFGEAAAMLYGTVQGLKEGLDLFGRTMSTGVSTDPMGKIETPRRAITSKNIGRRLGFEVNPNNPIPKTFDFLMDVIWRLPSSTALMAEDDFFKAMNWRMEVNALSIRKAQQEGNQGMDIVTRARELSMNPTTEMAKEAMEAARYRTFTNELGDFGKNFQKVLNASTVIKKGPRKGQVSKVYSNALRFIIPFFRTPVNIMKYAGHRTPLALKNALYSTGAEKDLAIAQMTLGSALSSMFFVAAQNGYITGGSEEGDKNLDWSGKRPLGWRPYSLKIGDKYYSLSGLEPIGTLVGTSADLAKMADFVTEDEYDRAAAMLHISFTEQIKNKSYLQGMANIIKVMEYGGSQGQRMFNQTMAGFIPNYIAQINRSGAPGVEPDPYIRDTVEFVNALKEKTFISGEVPARRNLWGDPIERDKNVGGGVGVGFISPMRYSEMSSPQNNPMHSIDVEIDVNDIRLSKFERKVFYNGAYVELTSEELAHVNDIFRDGGVKDEMFQLIGSSVYNSGSGGPEGDKANLMRNAYSRKKKDALRELFDETFGVPGGFASRWMDEQEKVQQATEQYQ